MLEEILENGESGTRLIIGGILRYPSSFFLFASPTVVHVSKLKLKEKQVPLDLSTITLSNTEMPCLVFPKPYKECGPKTWRCPSQLFESGIFCAGESYVPMGRMQEGMMQQLGFIDYNLALASLSYKSSHSTLDSI